MKKLISFDLDNTLWHVDPVIHKANQVKFDWLKKHYPSITDNISFDKLLAYREQILEQHPELVIDLGELRIQTVEKAAQESGFDKHKARQIAEEAFAVHYEMRNQVELFPGAKACLENLANNFSLIALSNGNADLNVIGINEFFTAHFKPTDVGAAKPDSAMFKAALKTLSLTPQQAIHIGDDLRCDIQPAKQLGFSTVFANLLEKSCDESEQNSDASFTHFDELEIIIDQLNR